MDEKQQPSNNPATQAPAGAQSAHHDTNAPAGAGSGAGTVVSGTQAREGDRPSGYVAQPVTSDAALRDQAASRALSDRRDPGDKPQGPGKPPKDLKDAADRNLETCRCNAVMLPHHHTSNGIEEVRL